MQCEITTGSEGDVGVGGHVIVIRKDNDDDNGNNNTNVISAEPRVGPVVGSESEDGVQSGVVLGLSKSVSVDGLVEGWSVAYTTSMLTTIATTNDNGIDNDDNEAQRATLNAGHDLDAPARRKIRRAVPDGVLKFKAEFVYESNRAQLPMNRHIKATVPAEVESGAEPGGMIYTGHLS